MFSCTPQNDLDCYYNAAWKRKHKRFVNNFVLADNAIKEELLGYGFEVEGFDKRLGYINGFLGEMIGEMQRLTGVSEWARYLGELAIVGIQPLVNVDLSMANVGGREFNFAIAVDIPSLTFESKEDYHNIEYLPKRQRLRRFLGIVERRLGEVGYVSEKFIENVITMETLLSNAVPALEDTIDPYVTNNYMSRNLFIRRYDVEGFWESVIGGWRYDWMVVRNLKYMGFLRGLLRGWSEIEGIMRDYVAYCIVVEFGIYIGLEDDIITLHDKKPTMKGSIRAHALIELHCFRLSNTYERRHHDSTRNDQVYQMFMQLKSTCLAKVKSQFYDKIKDIDLIIERHHPPILLEEPRFGDNFFYNVVTMRRFLHTRVLDYLQGLGRGLARELETVMWNCTVKFETNAYYTPLSNLVFIPTEFFHTTIFYDRALEAKNYGAIGAIIAHEMVHSFDVTGSKYDMYGVLRRGEVDSYDLRDYYSGERLANRGEDLADLVGLKIALATYLRTCAGAPDLREFFRAWAIAFRSDNHHINHDVHSSAHMRINAPLRHIPAYYALYHVTPHDKNYLPPSKRFTEFD